MTAVRLGLRANAGQFALLVGLNALVGGMVGLERSVLPLVGRQDFGLRSSSTILAFVVAFGAAKASGSSSASSGLCARSKPIEETGLPERPRPQTEPA